MKSSEVITFGESLSQFIIKGNHGFNIVEVIASLFTIQRDVIQLFIDNNKKD